MHNLYFTLIEHETDMTSEDAREQAIETLNENQFVYSGGYFSAGRCEWFQVGGQWSGCLNPSIREDEMRGTNNQNGIVDDAQIVNNELLNTLETISTENEQTIKVFNPLKSNEINLSELIENYKEYEGKYWLVIIDYFN